MKEVSSTRITIPITEIIGTAYWGTNWTLRDHRLAPNRHITSHDTTLYHIRSYSTILHIILDYILPNYVLSLAIF